MADATLRYHRFPRGPRIAGAAERERSKRSERALSGRLIQIKDALPVWPPGGRMSGKSGHRRVWRWDRIFRLVAVALVVAWSLAGVLHVPASAAPSDGTAAVAAHHLHGGPDDHHHAWGQACSVHGQCSGIALLPQPPVAALEASPPQVPGAAAALLSTSNPPIFRPPIASGGA
jgi:hypothetical protein